MAGVWMASEEVKLRKAGKFYLKKTFKIWCQCSLALAIISILLLLWAPGRNLTFGNLLSSVALTEVTHFSQTPFLILSLRPQQSTFNSFLLNFGYPARQGFKQARVFPDIRSLHLSAEKAQPLHLEEHGGWPIPATFSSLRSWHLTSPSSVNINALGVRQVTNPPCLPRLHQIPRVVPEKPHFLGMKWGRGSSDFSPLGQKSLENLSFLQKFFVLQTSSQTPDISCIKCGQETNNHKIGSWQPPWTTCLF